MRHRQLPGGLGRDGPERAPSRPHGADDHRRFAAVLLGRRPGSEPDALSRRTARRHLADRTGQRSRQRSLRRRLSGEQLRADNPGHNYWSKPYNLYSKIDTEEPRYLEFEKWWGGYFLQNAEEILAITSELFVGNKLTSGELVTPDGRRVDLRNIRSPILVFASFGDNITPPQQALGWILDLYDSVDDIQSREQTIIYNLHHDIGHLGIFVSGKIARRRRRSSSRTSISSTCCRPASTN